MELMEIHPGHWYTDEEIVPFLGVRPRKTVRPQDLIKQMRYRNPESVPVSNKIGNKRRTLGKDLAVFLYNCLDPKSCAR